MLFFLNYMVETLEHVFIQCVHVTMFWVDFQLDLKIYFGKKILLKDSRFNRFICHIHIQDMQ